MTTIRQIITDAYRESGTIQIGTTPEAEQFDEALRKLETIVSQLLGHEAGEGFETFSYGIGGETNTYAQDYDQHSLLESYYLPSNVRLIVNNTTDKVLYLNPNPQAGARFSIVDAGNSFGTNTLTLKGNGRNIDGATEITLNVNGTNSEWFYRDDLAEWVKVTDIDPDEQSPFPSEFDELLIISLALRLNPRYGQTVSPETMMFYRQVKSQFRSRYRQTEFVPSDVAMILRNGFSYGNSTNVFNRGFVAR